MELVREAQSTDPMVDVLGEMLQTLWEAFGATSFTGSA